MNDKDDQIYLNTFINAIELTGVATRDQAKEKNTTDVTGQRINKILTERQLAK